jgi:SAM-dependent methyltransferase
VPSGPRFRSDLYRGTARFYDEFRPAYPDPLFDDLRRRARITGAGRLLDLACGTGQITFGLCSDFAESARRWLVPDGHLALLWAKPEGVFREKIGFAYTLARTP